MPVVLGANLEPIPGYRLIERLGRGGFGEVWKAEAPGGLLKAIKFVYGDLSSAGEGAQAEQERKSLERIKSIRHPYILSLERIEEVDGQLVIVMELADRNLWDRFRECRAENLPGIPRDELLSYMQETAEALDLMNIRYQLQHLDVKPQNLFLIYNHIKVADFGLVKELRGEVSRMTGGVTPVYAAPETFNGFVSQQSDQYSLAIVYQELLTGQRPFNGTNAYQLLSQHVSKSPDLSPLPASDRSLVARSLAKKPEDRYASCTDLITALRNVGREAARTSHAPRANDDSRNKSSVLSTPDEASPTSQSRPATMQMRRSTSNPPPTQLQPVLSEVDSSASTSELAMPEDTPSTAASPIGGGPLVPAVIIGVGGIAAGVLRQMRLAIQSQFATPSLPHLRFIAVDTDSGALRKLTADPQCRFRFDEIYHAGLHRASHYLKAESATTIESWLGSQSLYKLPRNPISAIHRGFGRLAFFDHAASLARQLKSEIDACRQPSELTAASKATGLGIRSEKPRVYIVAGLGGGTGGGMFIDLAYLARHMLRDQFGPDIEVIGVFLLPSAENAGPAQPALVNAIASLTELNHFSSPNTQYSCRVNSKFSIPTDSGRPFSRCVLLPCNDAIDEAQLEKSAGQAAAILFHDVLSPLGCTADQKRTNGTAPDPVAGINAQAASTFRLAWPGRLLQQRAAHELALDLIRSWTARETLHSEKISQWLDEQWEFRRLVPEKIAEKFHQAATEAFSAAPVDKIESLIAPIIQMAADGEKVDTDDAFTVLEQIVQFLGQPDGKKTEGRASALPALFEKVTPDIIRQCDQQLAELAAHFVEVPGFRIGAAEECIRQIGDKARQSLTAYESLAESLSKEAMTQFRRLVALITTLSKPVGEGEKKPVRSNKRSDQTTQDLITLLRDYAKKHYQKVLATELTGVYRGIAGSVPEYLHDVNHCRLRLNEIEKDLAARLQADAHGELGLGQGKPLLSGATSSLVDAARQVVDDLNDETQDEFDNLIQDRVKKQFRSLVSFCLDGGPRTEILAEIIEAAAREYISTRLKKCTSLDVFLEEYDGDAATAVLLEAFDAAKPKLINSRTPIEAITAIIAAPNGEAGRKFRDKVTDVFAENQVTMSESTNDIVVYREVPRLELTDLPHFSTETKSAFAQAISQADQSPFCRVDIEWLQVR